MKPPRFSYIAPRSVEHALEVLAASEEDAAVLAGGQSLVPLLNMRFARPEVVVDINGIAALDTIDITSQGVTLGATVRLSRVETDPGLRASMPVLPQAASFVAHPQIRNRTTVGGTLCHADAAAELPAVAVALGARLHLRSLARGTRTENAEDFFLGTFSTTKAGDELLVAAEFPRHDGYWVGYDEVARRHGDFPFVGLCLALRMADGIVTAARAAAAGAGPRPVRLAALESELTGQRLTSSVAEAAAEAAAAEVDPPTDNHGTAAFRRGILRTLVRRMTTSQAKQEAA